MKRFPDSVTFQYPWRPYQARVLGELETHLQNQHLHVVAAPGSGKTVLGLEVTRRLNQPALIVAPTVAIRDQWIDRLVGMFCPPDTPTPDWISRDVRTPGFLTVSTYQGLFSAMKERGSDTSSTRQQVLHSLAKAQIGTLVLDEAHHLRNAWWQCLIEVKAALRDVTVVALTATAPFDVAPLEWERYIELCGPIDTEITVPELVREGNLCPHQDLVYLSAPLQSEQQEIRQYRQALGGYLQDLLSDQELIEALRQHPHVTNPVDHAEAILNEPAFYTSIAIFLKPTTGRWPKALLRVIGLPPRRCPTLDGSWWEILLAGLLYRHHQSFVLPEPLTRRLEKDLARLGAAHQRQIELDNPRKVVGRLVTSASKLTSIQEIVSLEQSLLGAELRLVILSDYIRRADFPRDADDLQPIKRLGVVPIFEQLRRAELSNLRLGILSGSLVVIPTEVIATLQDLATVSDISPDRIKTKPLAYDDTYSEVQVVGTDAHRVVPLITQLFNQGAVTTLVGTTSLLGEGWDAPSVNTLILASFVGSFMLSNQMRGRAIRTQRDNPTKTANIWHLVCQEPDQSAVGPDLSLMQRRFKAFSGVSLVQDSIQSGVERLGLGIPPFTPARIEETNAAMSSHAQARDALRQRWQRSLEQVAQGEMVEALVAEPVTVARCFVFANTLLALLWQGVAVTGLTLATILDGTEIDSDGVPWKGLLVLFMVASTVAILAGLPWFLKAFWHFLWHAPVASSVRQIGKAVLRTLSDSDQMESSARHLRVVTQKLDRGRVSCTLKGATTRDRAVFLEVLQELLGPIENPRYLLMRKTPLLRWLRKDYHPVPKALARNKELAETFQRYWKRFVGPTQLIYTRQEEGRQRLLHARRYSLASAFVKRPDRLRTWQ